MLRSTSPRRGSGAARIRWLLPLAVALFFLAGCGYGDPYAGQQGPAASVTQVTPTPSAGGDTFSEGANKKLVKFPNGLEYAEVKVGKGKLVKTGDTVELDYTLFGSNGKLVQTTKGSTPFQATLDNSSGLITGFVQGVTGMRVGGVRRIVIPPGSLSFPSSSWPSGIPKNSDVIFIVTVRSIVPTPSPTPTP